MFIATIQRRRRFADHHGRATFPRVARRELHVEPENEASWRTAESCGFDREGLLRSWQHVGTERRDTFIYSRLAEHAVRRCIGTRLDVEPKLDRFARPITCVSRLPRS